MIRNQAINQAIDYILAHITEPIKVDDIAAHCNFSKYYFSRLFKAETGESIYEFVKRIRIEQSAFRLKIERGRKITDIGISYGYSSSNYSSAFSQHYQMSPILFRRSILQRSLVNPIYHNAAVRLESWEQCEQKITVEWLPDYFVVYERHKGSYKNLAVHWDQFQQKYQAYISKDTKFIECTYDDPIVTDIDSCLYDICMTVPEGSPLEDVCTLKGGKFAIYHFNGPVSQMFSAFQNILTVWLPQSGCEIADRHGFDIYHHINCDEMIMEVDFCIPVK